MKIKNIVILFLSIITLSTILPSISAVYASENSQVTFTQKDADSLIPVFEAIESIPDNLLESGDSTEINKYFQNYGVELNVYNNNIGEESSDISIITPRANYWRCGLAIGQLLLSVAIPATQIAKIKKYIAALGGAWNAAKLLVGATSVSKKLQGTLSALAGILMSLTGISDIKDYCFG